LENIDECATANEIYSLPPQSSTYIIPMDIQFIYIRTGILGNNYLLVNFTSVWKSCSKESDVVQSMEFENSSSTVIEYVNLTSIIANQEDSRFK